MTDAAAKRSKYGPIRGTVVRVRSREEILATLDTSGNLDNLPFMPEMLKFCGQEIPVAARAEKTCDTIKYAGPRKMDDTVFLTGTRCDGSAHGGCQAGCNLFWREEWLEYADEPGRPIKSGPQQPEPAPTVDTLVAKAQREGDETAYRCQATEHVGASTPFPRRQYGQYIDDVRTGNAPLGVVLRGLLVFGFNKYQSLSRKYLPRWLRIARGRDYPFDQGTGTGERIPPVGLEAGDLVEIRSREEILATLDENNSNGRMWYDAPEMNPYCGRRVRVSRVVTRILDEKTGKIQKLSDCVVLDDVICMGLYHSFCQRAITPYWRSAWLRKVEEPPTTTAGAADDALVPSA